jgi:hemerythrin
MSVRMKWTKECRMDVDEIDAQHRLLFAIGNELLEIDDPENEAKEFKYLFQHLTHYVDTHFQTEEKYMKEIRYPDLEEHIKKHEQIIEEINETIKSVRNLVQLRKNLETLIRTWIQNHVLVEDKAYAIWHKENHKS